MSEASPAAQDSKELVAMVLQTLSSGQRVAPSDDLRELFELALDWQTHGQHAYFAEIHTFRHGAAPGRGFELMGRVAAAGEQIGLAGTCLLEARRWAVTDDGDQLSAAKVGMAVRALAEMTGYYAVSAAQGLINVTLRTLLVSPRWPTAANTTRRYRRGAGFPPFTSAPAAWMYFSRDEMDWLSSVVTLFDDDKVTRWFAAVVQLLDDQRWTVLASRRGEDFHRWRPQSISAGVDTKNPWQPEPGGGASLTIGATGSYQPLEPQMLVDEAADALRSLQTAMNTWMLLWPQTLKSLGCPIFKTDL